MTCLTLRAHRPLSFDTKQHCLYCHTPHSANTNEKYLDTDGADLHGAYLWNRAMPGQTFTVYNRFSLNYANTSTSPQPGTESRLCLSCHDGIGAINVILNPGTLTGEIMEPIINQFGDAPSDPYISRLNIGGAYGTGPGLDPSPGSGGTDLTDDHPIGFVFDSTLADDDGHLVYPVSSSAVDSQALTGDMNNPDPHCWQNE